MESYRIQKLLRLYFKYLNISFIINEKFETYTKE